jgi:nicotinate dehydrogenase subunit B
MLDARHARREVLKTGGALAVVFTLAPPAAQAQKSSWPARKVAPDKVESFIVIDANGMVALYSGKVDLGTGVSTAIPQILAEELSLPLDRITLVQGDTALTPNQGPTYASLSIQNGGMQIRRAAATAREALRDLAARRLGVAKSELAIRNGMISAPSGNAEVSYAQLVANQKSSLKIDACTPESNQSSRRVRPDCASSPRRSSEARDPPVSCPAPRPRAHRQGGLRICPLHLELPRCRGPAGRTRDHGFV